MAILGHIFLVLLIFVIGVLRGMTILTDEIKKQIDKKPNEPYTLPDGTKIKIVLEILEKV